MLSLEVHLLAFGKRKKFSTFLSDLMDWRAEYKLTALCGAVAVSVFLVRLLKRPTRPYESVESVGREYDKWATDGILEHYWGEHIHLGYYTIGQRINMNPLSSFLRSFVSATRAGLLTAEFKEAKFEFTRNLLAWSGVNDLSESEHVKVLDVGCGIGGTTRYLAEKRAQWTVTGISISPEQVRRATELALTREVNNCDFRCCDAMNMPFPDNSFDVVWTCESAEHMPDKNLFIRECVRVLKPGGKLVLATWCQRADDVVPFSESERSRLDFLYKEWCHPAFASIQAYCGICMQSGLEQVRSTDWTLETLPSWRHSIFVGIWSPWAVMLKPGCWWSTIREIVTLERMHCAFRDRLMEYGLVTGVKKK